MYLGNDFPPQFLSLLMLLPLLPSASQLEPWCSWSQHCGFGAQVYPMHHPYRPWQYRGQCSPNMCMQLQSVPRIHGVLPDSIHCIHDDKVSRDVVFYSHQTVLLGQLLLWYITWIKDETRHSVLICCNCDLRWKALVYTTNEFCRDGIDATKCCRSIFHKAAWAWHEDHGTLNSELVIVMFVRGEQEGKSLSSTAQCSFNEEWGLLRSHPTTEEELTPLVVNILRRADSPR